MNAVVYVTAEIQVLFCFFVSGFITAKCPCFQLHCCKLTWDSCVSIYILLDMCRCICGSMRWWLVTQEYFVKHETILSLSCQSTVTMTCRIVMISRLCIFWLKVT